MRSQAFSSSRTLPGQGYRWNDSRTVIEICGVEPPRSLKNRRMKWSVRSGMSSRRSRSGGSQIGTTFRR